MNVSEDTYTVMVPRFNGTKDDGCHLLCLRMKAEMRRESVAGALANDNVSAEMVNDNIFSWRQLILSGARLFYCSRRMEQASVKIRR